ncbi:MAG: T9SS type A sorting domain-containing protein [Saprospiraceae bacterium]|nr:T9SS type A sorting domain-containing protein [Saprospiraceae bacterium]
MRQAYPRITKLIFLFFIALGLLPVLSAQENRSIDGYGNNLANPTWGAVDEPQVRMVSTAYTDGIKTPAGQDRPNPRMISNEIFAQPELLPDPMGLSDFAWVFGQFIDHDITLVENGRERLDISVPAGDPIFDPLGTGFLSLRMNRSKAAEGTGEDLANPRQHVNKITSFIDGSAVYGSDEYRNAWLRTFADGKLRVSSGDLLPYNTISGEEGSLQDLVSPPMDNQNPRNKKWFIAGDARANENPLLLSLHTLFMREHNRVCDELKAENPSFSDEELFQKARKIVGGIIQAVVYEEWLPSLGVQIPSYAGYDAQVNPGIMAEFSTAAFRFGHTVLNGVILRMDNDGSTMPEGDLFLRDAFFMPSVIKEMGDIYPYLVGMSTQIQQSFDTKVIDDVRNFLFGPPGQGGLDLAAMNINRGRDRGLPDYNTIRTELGKEAISDFSEICRDQALCEKLREVYEDVNDIDPWVGFLAEDRISDNALFGSSVMLIMEEQFAKLRDGDRFYYENDPGLTDEEKLAIKQTRLTDVIMRNVDVEYMQGNVFLAEDRGSTTSFASINQPTLKMSVYPNPIRESFNLEFQLENGGDAELTITNVMGQTVQSRRLPTTAGDNTFNMILDESLTNGIYQVRISKDGDYGVHKLVVARS